MCAAIIPQSKKIIILSFMLVYYIACESPLSAQTMWTGSSSSDWNTVGNWSSGVVPDASTAVIIPNSTPNSPVIATGVNATAASVTINSGAILSMTGSGDLTISNGGTFSNNGAFSSTGTGAVIFAGSGTITGIISFKNVTINGAVDFGTSSTVTEILLLNPGGAAVGANTHLVNYAASSTLIYNETTSTANEWFDGKASTMTAGAGIPQNVTIQSGTVTVNTGTKANRAIAGNLLINAGATLQLAAGANPDLYILGDWTNYGEFIANAKTVIFNAQSTTAKTQSLTGTTTFYNLTFGNSNITTNFGSSTINILNNFRNDGGSMNGNVSNINFTGTSGSVLGGASKFFYNLSVSAGDNVIDNVSSTGDIHISNSFTNHGTFSQLDSHTTYFDKTNSTEYLYGTGSTTFGNFKIGTSLGVATTLNAGTHNFTISGNTFQFNCSGSVFTCSDCMVTFGLASAGTITIKNSASVSNTSAQFHDVSINSTASSISTAVNFGSGIATVNADLTINTYGSVIINPVVYSSSSTLRYNTATSNYTTGFEWSSNNSSAGAGVPQNVAVTNTNAVLIANDRTVPGTLTLSAGSLDINSHTLTVTSGFAGTGGNLKGSNSSNLIAGGTGTINFDATANYLKNLTINGNANISLGSALNIAASNGSAANTFGTVTVNAGAVLDATTSGYLNLKSDMYGDAIVGQSYGTISGNVTVERYVPKVQRAWHFLSMPFNASSTETLNQSWQEGAMPYPYADNSAYSSNSLYNPKPGYGTEITYDNYTGNGFDVNITYNPSLKIWDYSTKTWSTWAPHTNTTKITDYPAYCLFVRGDRSVNLSQGTAAPVAATTLRATGQLNESAGAPVTPISQALNNNDFLFVGNPYASPVLFSSLQFTNINANYFYVWDPKIGGMGHGVGAYVTYSFVNPLGWSITTGGSYSTSTPPVIQSGQAFLVQSKGGNSAVTFPQNAKNTSEFSAGRSKARPALFLQLAVPDDSMKVTDGATVVFGNGFSSGRDEFDAPKLWNFTENMALQRDTSRFAVEARPIPKLTDTIFLKLYLYHQTYALKIFSINLPGNLPAKAWIVDKYLDTETTINLYDTTFYNFTANEDTNSYRDRFMLVFNKQFVAKPEPVSKVANNGDTNEIGIADGSTHKSKGVNVYPNPVTDGKLILHFANMDKGRYKAMVYNTTGQNLLSKTFDHPDGDGNYPLLLNPAWAAGEYSITIVNQDSGKMINVKFVVNK